MTLDAEPLDSEPLNQGSPVQWEAPLAARGWRGNSGVDTWVKHGDVRDDPSLEGRASPRSQL